MTGPTVSDLARRETLELAATIVDIVADHFGTTARLIRSRKVADGVAWARQVAIHLVNEFTGEPTTAIARMFNLDRTTVTHALERVKDMKAGAPRVSHDLSDLVARIEKACPETKHRTETAIERHRRLSARLHVMPRVVAGAELDSFLRDLRKGLAMAIHLDPGRVLAGIKRTVDEINNKETSQ